jgi:MFS family permease
MFAVHGMSTAIWVSYLPVTKERNALSDFAVAMLLLSISCGAGVGMYIFGWIVRPMGNRNLTRLLAALVPAGPALSTLAWNQAALMGFAFAMGALNGLLNVAMNLEAVELQRELDRPLVGSFHALWSGANIVGAVVAGAALVVGVSPAAMFGSTSLLLAALAIAAGRLLPNTAASDEREFLTTARTPVRVWLLGVLAMGALLCEGAVGDWAGIHLHDVLQSSLPVAACGYGCYSVAAAVGRLANDRALRTRRPEILLRLGCFAATAGVLMVVVAPLPALALVGWTITGLGIAGVVPMVYSAAGTDPSCAPPQAMARASAVGYLGLLIGPVVIGDLAGEFGLRTSFLLLAIIALAIGVAGVPLISINSKN